MKAIRAIGDEIPLTAVVVGVHVDEVEIRSNGLGGITYIPGTVYYTLRLPGGERVEVEARFIKGLEAT